MTAGLRGLLPLDPEKHARFKGAEEYGFTYPAPTYPIDKTGGITDLGMGGNGPDPTLTVNGGQPVGDCGPCAVPMHANMVTAVLAGLELSKYAMTSDQIVTLYLEYTGGQDTGVDLGDWLLWLFQKGLIEGFVKVDLADLDAALATFDVVVVGVNLNPEADNQVNAGQPWDVSPGDEPDPSEGHAILLGKAVSPSGPFMWGTWGQWQESTLAWKEACPQQAFAVLTKPEADSKDFPFEELVRDLTDLGGTAIDPPIDPAPSTPPAPAEPPAPAPEPQPPVPVEPPSPVDPPAPVDPPEPTPSAPVPIPEVIAELIKDIEEAIARLFAEVDRKTALELPLELHALLELVAEVGSHELTDIKTRIEQLLGLGVQS